MPEAERVKIGLCCLRVFCHEEQRDLMRDFIQSKSENIQQCLCTGDSSREAGTRAQLVCPNLLGAACAMRGSMG